MSTGKMLGIGAAGLVGGAIIGDMIENHEEDERFDAYEDGEFVCVLLAGVLVGVSNYYCQVYKMVAWTTTVAVMIMAVVSMPV